MSSGKLYLVATPIGNLEDVTLRALRILKEVDLIACEDTRHTARLLTHFGIATARESYHDHNETTRTPRLLELLRSGKNIALVSDAGTPLLSDPGHVLVQACRAEGIEVIPIPGPAAAIAALTGSGLPADNFLFAGFLPSKRTGRRKALERLAEIPATLVIYEAPHRVVASLRDMLEILGPRQACLVRELTKMNEEWLRGTLMEILKTMEERPRILGEITLVVNRGESLAKAHVDSVPLRQQIEEEMKTTGASRKEALALVARKRGISRNQAYRRLLEEK
jgi:16S rRNA (cytidine1402-2'-O)-methyltransferase